MHCQLIVLRTWTNILVYISDVSKTQKIHLFSFFKAAPRNTQSYHFPKCSILTCYHSLSVLPYCTLKYCSIQLSREGLGWYSESVCPGRYIFSHDHLVRCLGLFTDWYRHVMLRSRSCLHAITTWGQPFSHAHVWIKYLLLVGVHAVNVYEHSCMCLHSASLNHIAMPACAAKTMSGHF